MSESTDPSAPELRGLVLTGGRGRRMGRDKGLLEYSGQTAVRRAWGLLNSVCVDALVSVREEQAPLPGYAALPLVVDRYDDVGPAAGLLTAWDAHPDAAWLALAVDLPLVDGDLLLELVRGRDSSADATAFRHADGVLEPLCTIWEPSLRAALGERVSAGRRSLRGVLEDASVAVVTASEPRRLAGVDSPERYAAIRQELA